MIACPESSGRQGLVQLSHMLPSLVLPRKNSCGVVGLFVFTRQRLSCVVYFTMWQRLSVFVVAKNNGI